MVIFLLPVLGIMITPTNAMLSVNFTASWKPNVGGILNCSWTFPAPDRDYLQSVRLLRREEQFFIYRPQVFGHRLYQQLAAPDGGAMHVDCSCLKTYEQVPRNGSCIIILEPRVPPKSIDLYTCEVSGEGPMFWIDAKNVELEAFVLSNDTEISATMKMEPEAVRVVLNCSATGIPAPTLTWTIGNQKIPADFSRKLWNETTRLAQVWSSLTLTPKEADVSVLCTPEQTKPMKQQIFGQPKEYILKQYNYAWSYSSSYRVVIVAVWITLARGCL